MYVITFLNEKGGVGKTTLAGTTAAGLAIRGNKVLLIDSDPQGHATLMFGLAKEAGLYNLLVNDALFSKVMRPIAAEVYAEPGKTAKGELFVLPSNVETRNIVDKDTEVSILLERLEELEGKIDVVVFDTSPTPSLLHGLIYLATDAIIYPTKLEFWSFDGLVESLSHRIQAETIRPKFNQKAQIDVMGIVPNMYRTSTVEQNDNLEKLKKQFGATVWKPILLRTVWTEISSYQQSVFAFAPDSQAARDAWSLIASVERGIYATTI